MPAFFGVVEYHQPFASRQRHNIESSTGVGKYVILSNGPRKSFIVGFCPLHTVGRWAIVAEVGDQRAVFANGDRG